MIGLIVYDKAFLSRTYWIISVNWQRISFSYGNLNMSKKWQILFKRLIVMAIHRKIRCTKRIKQHYTIY